jgi:hypothetical protein
VADPVAEADRVAGESVVEAAQAEATVLAPGDWALELAGAREAGAEQALAPEAKAALREDGWRHPR